MKNFIEELRWRGMIQDIMPETEQHLMEGLRAAYVGIDPTADSLQYANPKEAFFVAVIDDNREELTEALFELLKDKLGVQTKKAFAERFRLKDYFDVCYQGWVEAKMMRPSAAKITTTTIHRLPAMVVETTEQVNGNKVFYIVAVVETEKTYYQIFTWTLDSKKTQNEQQMKEIISSFREL